LPSQRASHPEKTLNVLQETFSLFCVAFRLHKRQGITWLVKWLQNYEEQLCFIEFVFFFQTAVQY
jgi:hypothetical protein